MTALPLPDASVKCLVWDASALGVGFQGHARALILNRYAVPPVSGLLKRSGPAAVAGFVVPIDVNAIQRRSCWSRTHVSEECRKVVLPLLMHADASRAVRGVLRVVGIVATRLGVVPCPEFRGRPPLYRMAMLQRPLAQLFGFQAAATCRSPGPDRVSNALEISPARARKQPDGSATFVGSPAHSGKQAVSFASDIQRCSHVR